jgi:N-acetylmuramoyl-L-alanine amidase
LLRAPSPQSPPVKGGGIMKESPNQGKRDKMLPQKNLKNIFCNSLGEKLLFIITGRTYSHITRLFFALVMLLVFAVPLFAQKKTDVLLKFSMQDKTMRIVLESEEPFLAHTKITTSASQIKIEFPRQFGLITPKEPPFEAIATDKLLTINLKEHAEIKIFRLSSPARIVFDIQKERKQPVEILSKVFVIDAGHGGYDYGITSKNMKEKDISLSLAQDLDTILSKKGKRVFLTRKADQYMSLIERIRFVNQKTPDIFLSLHSSMSEDFVLYIAKFKSESNEMADQYSLSLRQKKYIGKSKVLAENIGNAIKEEFKKTVIYREMPLPVLNSAGAPAVFIEYPSAKSTIYDQPMRARLIKAIINGFATYSSTNVIAKLN